MMLWDLVTKYASRNSGISLPYTFDPSALGDGALPSPWVGSTFAISSGLITNTPTAGSNLLTDGGVEANYTAGKCDTLTMNGTPTVAQSADVHEGSKAQSFTAIAYNNRLNYPVVGSITAGSWYRFSVWGKRTAGSNANTHIDLYQSGMLPAADNYTSIQSASYVKKVLTGITTGTGNITPFIARDLGSSAWNTVIVDDGTLEKLTFSTLFAMMDQQVTRTASVKVKPSTLTDSSISCGVLWANANTNPTSFVMAWYRLRLDGGLLECGIIKCVSGTYSQVLAPQALTYVSGAWLELRPIDDSTVALYYNDVQAGTNQTVNDVAGNYCGMGVSGGNALQSFFVG